MNPLRFVFGAEENPPDPGLSLVSVLKQLSLVAV